MSHFVFPAWLPLGGIILALATQAVAFPSERVLGQGAQQGLVLDDVQFEHFSHSAIPDYKLRIKEPRLCDPTVKQYSGYLDVAESKHLFFWLTLLARFFEARNNPETAPIVIWLNGGPGCTSAMGLFFALGPCSIEKGGNSTTVNDWSWNNNANLLFIDRRFYAFLRLNLYLIVVETQNPLESDTRTTLDPKSPTRSLRPKICGRSSNYSTSGSASTQVNCTSLENRMPEHTFHISPVSGLTNPSYQLPVLYDWWCGKGKWPVYDQDSEVCKQLARDIPVCQRLLKVCVNNVGSHRLLLTFSPQSCEDYGSDIVCGTAGLFCFDRTLARAESGLNPYDARMKCGRTEDSECYDASRWIPMYLNRPEIRRQLGGHPDVLFTSCNITVHKSFIRSGDAARNSALLLPDLINDGVRMLIYVGDADSPATDFRTHNRTAGFVRSTGGNKEAGRIAYVELFEAGHMAPHDQPDAALDMSELCPRILNSPSMRFRLVLLSLAFVCPSLGSVIFQNGQPEGVEPETNDVQFEHFSHTALPNSKLRVKSPSKLCDPSVKQYSGYLDISEDKHVFFWFFEARNNPGSAPVAIWLNGGPGCSSSTGLFLELGPCTVSEGGRNTTINPWSWNTNVNMLFIDQPAGVGYSYNTGSTMTNSLEAAKDMWVFLQLFYRRFGEYAGELHVAGESYAGIYIPYIAHKIWENNKQVDKFNGDWLKINLTSIMIGGGLTHPWYQFGATYDWWCGGGKWQVWKKNSTECKKLKKHEVTCLRMIEYCDKVDTDLVCGATAQFCLEEMTDMINQSGLNLLDARSNCDARNGSFACYPEVGWMSKYLNYPDVKSELGIASHIEFKRERFICLEYKTEVTVLGYSMHQCNQPSIYSFWGCYSKCGCIAPRNDRRRCEDVKLCWGCCFVNSFRENSQSGDRIAGHIRTTSSGNDSGRIALMEIHEAGHLAPHDQPQATLDMFNRWIFNLPLATGEPSMR
ncbi:carboxypeptidase C [Rhizoctonia solani AG-1 IA]|uniref:Carboxypeptidase n=1 Tax=Thanatephorus cucumeris (strain AG1-IA) TaxID=983506 RepID=L8WRP8_THACA|nr:carboxypeptidase C [Rhizoctonia solani AG-1 IA]